MILCNERVDAETALRIGLVEQVVDSGEARGAALLLAAKVARQSPVAIRTIKPLIQGARERAPNTWLPEERERFVDLFDAQDTREGVNAFLEARSQVAQLLSLPIEPGGLRQPAEPRARHERAFRRTPEPAWLPHRHCHPGCGKEPERPVPADDRGPGGETRRLGRDAGIACVLLRGNGAKRLCAGGDAQAGGRLP